MHGHIEELIERGVDTIFYPCLSYNIDEHQSANHYNCPVVAYYSELLHGNMDSLAQTDFFYPYLNLDSEKILSRTLSRAFREKGTPIADGEIKKAVRAGFAAYHKYMDDVRAEGQRALAFARQHGNDRLLCKIAEQYIYSVYGHLQKALVVYRKELRKELRTGLKLGRECGCFPWNRKNLWAYEAAYPCKLFWWIFSKLQK
jgi:hypothetical protein